MGVLGVPATDNRYTTGEEAMILAKGLHTVSNFLFRYCLVYTWNLIN